MSDFVGSAKQVTVTSRDRLLKTFSFVPDEKLTWSPSSTARSALQIAAHAGASNGQLASIVRGEPFTASSPAEIAEQAAEAEAAVKTREQAIALVNESTDVVLAALDRLTPEQLGSTVETPFFAAPMSFWMYLPARHMENHASQIDYLQTCWGDSDWHM